MPVASSPSPVLSSPAASTDSSPKSYAQAVHLTPFSRPISASSRTQLFSLKPVTPNLTTLSHQSSVTPSCSQSNKRPRSSPSTSPTMQSPPEKRTTCALFAKSSAIPHQVTVGKHEGGRKSAWALPVVRKSLLVIGDSNLSRISASPIEDIQIESFSGAQFHHITNILKKYEHTEQPDKVLFNIGINNRKSNPAVTSLSELRNMLSAAQKCFPNSDLYIPAINFSDRLEAKDKENLERLNKAICETQKRAVPIPTLSSNYFKINGIDAIHWTVNTANSMLKHWLGHLN